MNRRAFMGGFIGATVVPSAAGLSFTLYYDPSPHLVTVSASNEYLSIEFDVSWNRNEAMKTGQVLKAEIGNRTHLLSIDSITPCPPPLPAGAHAAEQPTKDAALPLSNSPAGSTMIGAGQGKSADTTSTGKR